MSCCTLSHIDPKPTRNASGNHTLLKRLRIAHALYTTCNNRKDPSELMYERTFQTKLPDFKDIEATPPTTDFSDKERIKKHGGIIERMQLRGLEK